MTWEISSVVTVLGTAFALLYLSINLPEENRSVRFYLFREWVRIAMLILAFLLILTNFFVTYQITILQNSAIAAMIDRWYIYLVVVVLLLAFYFFIRIIIETVRSPIVAFDEIKKNSSKLTGKYNRGNYGK